MIRENAFEATLEDDNYEGEWSSCGILPWESSNLEIEDNTFNLEGPSTVGLGSYDTNMKVENNNFQSADYHVREWYTQLLDLETIFENNDFPEEAEVIGNTIRDVEENTVYNQDTGEEYDEIQTAIDGAGEGHTILVGPGTYTESLSINTDGLELRGISREDVTIDTSEDGGYGIHIEDTDGLSISGITLDGSEDDNIHAFLVKVDNSENFAVEDFRIIGPGRDYLSDDSDGYQWSELVGGLDLNNVNSATINNVDVEEVSRNGISFTDVTNIHMEDFSVENSGHTDSYGAAAVAFYDDTTIDHISGDIEDVRLGINMAIFLDGSETGNVEIDDAGVAPLGGIDEDNTDDFALEITDTPWKLSDDEDPGPAYYYHTEDDAIAGKTTITENTDWLDEDTTTIEDIS